MTLPNNYETVTKQKKEKINNLNKMTRILIAFKFKHASNMHNVIQINSDLNTTNALNVHFANFTLELPNFNYTTHIGFNLQLLYK